MEITIYELLGMVKDGKGPKRIMYNNIVWEYIEIERDYRSKHNAELFFNDEINNTWIMTHLNTKVEILEEEKKIPEKLPYYSMEKIQKAKNKDEWREERITLLEKRVNDLHIEMNDLIDYLESKGDE